MGLKTAHQDSSTAEADRCAGGAASETVTLGSQSSGTARAFEPSSSASLGVGRGLRLAEPDAGLTKA